MQQDEPSAVLNHRAPSVWNGEFAKHAETSAHAGGGPGKPAAQAIGQLIVGVSGARRNAALAACVGGTLTSFCERERLTRVRGMKLDPAVLPREVLDVVLKLAGRTDADVMGYATAEDDVRLPSDVRAIRTGHHEAHAAGAFFTSPFDEAAVIVCDHHTEPSLSIWNAGPDGVRICRSVMGQGLASLYSACAGIFGFRSGEEHHFEALARLDGGNDADRLCHMWGYSDGVVWANDGWQASLADWLGEREDVRHRAQVAAACQRRIGQILVAIARDARAAVLKPRLCLGGGLFYNTYLTTLLRQEATFEDVFVAPNPGNAGLAAGAALAVSQSRSLGGRGTVSAFLGPEFGVEEIKATLDNCKLSYECPGEADVITMAVDALRRGNLVGWFHGRMEWAHRSLGNRSILASPCSPYVLENLNVFLKQRASYRAYGVSVPEQAAPRFFSGPPISRFMEFEYQVSDEDRLRHILPAGTRALRVQTIPIADDATRRFRLLHEAFGAVTGLPVLVNTSFNSFSEPMVCTPRDAIRVFFGTGLDMLVMDRFVLRK